MARTVPHMIYSKAEQCSDRVALRHKVNGRYRDIVWKSMVNESRRFGQALLALGLEPGERVAIMAPNGPACSEHTSLLEERIAAGQGSDTASLVYTSGTTGHHKGVILSHDNILASIADAVRVFDIGPAYTRVLMSGNNPSIFIRAAIALARPLTFSKLRKRLGRRMRYFISGGAPLMREVAEFFFAADIPIYEGYGLTESTSGIATNTPGSFRLGTVGKVFPHTKIRIAGDGEILLSGPAISRGYWNRPEQTEENFREGWFRTGDIGELDEDGFLTITDRKKDLIITATGENIAPQELEKRFKSDRYLSNAIIFGDRKPFLTALLVPNFETLEKYAHRHQIDYLNHCDLVSHPDVLELIRRHVDRLQQDLPAFNQVKRFTLLSRDFNSDRGEMTPTLKLKRRTVARNFSSVISNMYLDRDQGIHDSGFCMVDDKDELS